jgi:hypothetical protein
MVYDANDANGRVHCRLAWSEDPARAHSWKWVETDGLDGREFIPLGSTGAFDSHICFAAKPVTTSNSTRVYYFGGNGPHSGARNSSLGLAWLPNDRFAALQGDGRVRTIELTVGGPRLIVTADFTHSNGSLVVGVVSGGEVTPPELSPGRAVPIKLNGTDTVVHYEGNANYDAVVGKRVVLELTLSNAAVYTIGWAPAHDR